MHYKSTLFVISFCVGLAYAGPMQDNQPVKLKPILVTEPRNKTPKQVTFALFAKAYYVTSTFVKEPDVFAVNAFSSVLHDASIKNNNWNTRSILVPELVKFYQTRFELQTVNPSPPLSQSARAFYGFVMHGYIKGFPQSSHPRIFVLPPKN